MRVLLWSKAFCRALKSVRPFSFDTTTSPSSQPARSFMPSGARTRCGIFALQSRPLRLIMLTLPSPSIGASMR